MGIFDNQQMAMYHTLNRRATIFPLAVVAVVVDPGAVGKVQDGRQEGNKDTNGRTELIERSQDIEDTGFVDDYHHEDVPIKCDVCFMIFVSKLTCYAAVRIVFTVSTCRLFLEAHRRPSWMI